MGIVLRNDTKKSIIVTNTETGKKLSLGPGATIAGDGYRQYANKPLTVIVDAKPSPILAQKAKDYYDQKVIRATGPTVFREEPPPELKGNAIHVKVPPGIGDISWIHSKLVTLRRSIIYSCAQHHPSESKEFCELLPNVHSARYGDFTTQDTVLKTIDPSQPFPESFTEGFICLNTWLEHGNRLENAFPGSQTDFHYPFKLDASHRIDADRLARERSEDRKLLGIYTSGWGTVRAWDGWKPHDWRVFLRDFLKRHPDWMPILVGPQFDVEFMCELCQLLDQEKIVYQWVVGLHIGIVISLMIHHLSFLMGPALGIPVLANVCRVPCYVQYPPKLDTLRQSWHDPVAPYRGEVFQSVDDTIVSVEEMLP